MATKTAKKPRKPVIKKTTAAKLEAQMLDMTREAIVKSGGNMADVARVLGLNRRTVARRVERYPELQEELLDTRESTLDLAEAKLIVAIKMGEAWAICFYLKCQGKKRGYIERQELTGKDGRPLNAQYKAEELSDGELAAIANANKTNEPKPTHH